MRRLVPHWVTLHGDLGLRPSDAGGWTLDTAITAELYAEQAARERRIAAARAKGR